MACTSAVIARLDARIEIILMHIGLQFGLPFANYARVIRANAEWLWIDSKFSASTL